MPTSASASNSPDAARPSVVLSVRDADNRHHSLRLLPSSSSAANASSSFTLSQTVRPSKVAVIKQHCATKWPEDFGMRVFCEDQEYVALKKLVEHGSVTR